MHLQWYVFREGEYYSHKERSFRVENDEKGPDDCNGYFNTSGLLWRALSKIWGDVNYT